MSASTTSLPDPDLPHQDPIQPDFSSPQHLPPDPLLSAGSFIDSSASRCRTIPSPPNHAQDLDGNQPDSSATRRSPPRSEPLNANNLSPDPPAAKKSASSDPSNWLPPGWVMEDKVRSSGATAGTVDKYYFDPVSGRRFRSKLDVLYFLETGTLRKRKKSLDGNATSADAPEEPKSKKSSSKAKSAPLNFDFLNVPEKVEWVLTDPSKEAWTPFISKAKISESTKREWERAFQHLSRSKAEV